jgi:CheY-like chemotaxis protein
MSTPAAACRGAFLHLVKHLVEDDDAVRACISERLRKAGYEVTAISTTTAALKQLDSDQRFDLAVIDVKMPPGHPHGFAWGAWRG